MQPPKISVISEIYSVDYFSRFTQNAIGVGDEKPQNLLISRR